ncbi:DUF2785 domain-containing protein [Paenibacillus sp. FSL F4-0087]|uniref:DUF2785 domain-containing protein n=1 Tax=Paenibacillus taichungensis TaxID=484184 RepID=A0ABX2MWG5_9BACL|nr:MULTISPECIES: DUF2785 domain-containing protein [Paenibacillus]MDR9744329.1 DUF2785 domain-containing protein [Paenibacillus taichungensis]NUU58437.1 DUF2785 domain-containing protein [Paenibacillus taichungensis]OME77331.1 hypothetical protein BK122_27245 [Paenibacillus pabuli]PIH60123.1 DUF2785 domain-containing protein [Paenibacillus sp. LK1]
MSLKEKLILVKENDYQTPLDTFQLIQEMMVNIGSLDAQLRDDLIYTTLSNWIPDNTLTVNELEQLLSVVLDNKHLLFRLGETNTDSVFTRSFSMLVIPLLFMRHKESPFLSKEHIHQIKEIVFYNVHKERDYRGYDEEKGWAHAIAHAADALDELAQCSELDKNDLLTILDLVYEKMTITDRVYSDGEDERMVKSIISVLNRKILSQTYVEQWIQRFGDVEKNPEFLPAFRQKNNIKNFLKSLYFRIKFHKVDADLCPTIEHTLYKIEKVYYS